MRQADLSAASGARDALLTSAPRERSGAREVVIAVLVIAGTLGVVLFVALVVVPSAGAAGGCGGG